MVWLKRLLVASGLGLISVAGWLWLTMLSPWFYDRPDALPAIEQRTHHVFVYGTLRYAPVRFIVMGSVGEPEKAVLEGYRRNGLDLTQQPESQVEGLRLRVDASELARLDRYERLGIRYERVKKTLHDGSSAWVYLRLPEAQHAFSQPAVSSLAQIFR
ncbi:unnamed protein product [Ectocarpus sp. 12 AP-2014]